MAKAFLNFVGAAALALVAASAAAQEHLHEGDIEVSVVNGKLVTSGGHHTEYGTGYGIFEGDLDIRRAIPLSYRGSDPGFDSEAGTFAPSDMIYFAPIGTLGFWDGDSWESPGSMVLIVRDSVDGTATYSGTGVTTSVGFDGFISDGGPTGSIHQHLAFTVQSNPAGVEPPVGAYRIAMQLTSPSYTSSDPFWIVFNRGLGEEAFEESAHVMSVPEPETYALMALGLGFVSVVARRRRA